MPTGVTKIFEESFEKEVYTIIPAAGMGTRMKTYGAQSLIKFKNRPLISYQLEYIKNVFPKGQICVVSGYESDKVMNTLPNDVIKLENPMYFSTNVCKSISIGLRAKQDCKTLMLVMGDLFFNQLCIENLDCNKSSLILSSKMDSSEVGCIMDNKYGYITNIMYDLPHKWGQIVLLTGKELDIFKKFILNPNNKTKYAFEAINDIIDRGGKIKGITDDNMIAVDIDSPKDLRKVRETYESSF